MKRQKLGQTDIEVSVLPANLQKRNLTLMNKIWIKIKRLLMEIPNGLALWAELIIPAWPESRVGKKLRHIYWSRKYALTSHFQIARTAKLYGNKYNIFIGERFCCGEQVEINFSTSKGIYIGNDVLMARGVYLRSGNHKFDRLDIPINQQGHDCSIIQYQDREYSIVIEDDVWIGANAIILSGAKIGKGSVVAAGAVVPCKEFPPYAIIAGNPAREIKSRCTYDK